MLTTHRHRTFEELDFIAENYLPDARLFVNGQVHYPGESFYLSAPTELELDDLLAGILYDRTDITCGRYEDNGGDGVCVNVKIH